MAPVEDATPVARSLCATLAQTSIWSASVGAGEADRARHRLRLGPARRGVERLGGGPSLPGSSPTAPARRGRRGSPVLVRAGTRMVVPLGGGMGAEAPLHRRAGPPG